MVAAPGTRVFGLGIRMNDPNPDANARGRSVALASLVWIPVLIILGLIFNDLLRPGFRTSQVSLPTSTSLAPLPEVMLQVDGIEAVSFGDPVESLHSTMTELLGSPDMDSLQPCVDGDEGGRWIRWGDISTMSEGGYFRAFVHGVFFPALSNPVHIPARTQEGLALGMTATELQVAYGDRVRFGEPYLSSDGGEVRPFGIDGYNFYQSTKGIGGYLKGDLEVGTVITIVGGLRCPTLRDLQPD